MKFVKSPKITIVVTLDKRVHDDPSLEVTLLLPGREERDKWLQFFGSLEPLNVPETRAEYLDKGHTLELSILKDKVVSWSKVFDEDGKPIPYSYEKLEEMCTVYADLADYIVSQYLRTLIPVKNS